MSKYLEMKKNGKYEYVSRKIGKEGAAVVIPMKPTSESMLFQLIVSKRATFEKPILEFPAGLIDKENESIEEVALRELREETGWVGNVCNSIYKSIKGIPFPTSAGISDEVVYFVPVILNEKFEPELEGDEQITTLPLMTINEIWHYIENYKNQYEVSSRLLMFLYGWYLGKYYQF